MRHLLIAAALTFALAAPSSSYALTAQQQHMADCNTQAGGMRGQARKVFLQKCENTKPAGALHEQSYPSSLSSPHPLPGLPHQK